MSIAIRAERLFDGVGDRVTEQPVVLVEDGRITAVDAGRTPPLPEQVQIIDLGDATLLPGLIDTHSHLGLDGVTDPEALARNKGDGELVLAMRKAALSALRSGVTTIRDLGDHRLLSLTVRDWFAGGAEIGPQILCAGTPITITGGHGHFMGAVADGELEVRKAVRALNMCGVNVIKVMGSGGRLTPKSNTFAPQYDSWELRAAVDEAHRHGLKLTVHAYPPQAIAQAVEAGVDGIEHCFFTVAGGLAPDEEIIDAIAKRDIVVSPTLGLDPQWPVPPGFQAFLDAFQPVVQMMHKSGVQLLAGPDAGSVAGKPHDVLPHAVRTLASLGLTNPEALRSATSVAARACDVEERKGAVRAGMDADLIAVRGNPITDIDAIADVFFVLRAGEIVRDDRPHRPHQPHQAHQPHQPSGR